VPDEIADANDSDVVDTVSELAVVPACDTDTVRVMPPPVTVTVPVRAVVPVFALVALAGYLAGAPVVGAVATGFALVAALLNAVFRLCLGCEMYLFIRRLLPAGTHVDAAAENGRENQTDNRFENTEKVIT